MEKMNNLQSRSNSNRSHLQSYRTLKLSNTDKKTQKRLAESKMTCLNKKRNSQRQWLEIV